MSLLFAYGRFSHDVAHMYPSSPKNSKNLELVKKKVLILIQGSPFIMLCLGSTELNHVIKG